MLAQNKNLVEDSDEIKSYLAAYQEWLFARSGNQTFALGSSEIEISELGEKLLLSCLTERGWQTWRIVAWKKENEKLVFCTAKTFKSVGEQLELIPRVSIENLREDVNAVRLAFAQQLAFAAQKTFLKRVKIDSVRLTQSSQARKLGTIAKITLALPDRKFVAICGSIVADFKLENLFSHAILWFSKLQTRRETKELWIVAEEKSVERMQKLTVLLRGAWRKQIKLWSFKFEENLGIQSLNLIAPIEMDDLWHAKPSIMTRAKTLFESETAQKIRDLAPHAIDIIRSKHGETLRYHGLPFVRVRSAINSERVWFGAEQQKQILDRENLADFEQLLMNLREIRNSEPIDKQNFFYKSAPEAWPESLLRRGVNLLDPNLILAPLYPQFRLTPNKHLDLLALRRDGRLAVIELKTTTDREHVFQAVGYWQQIELLRRSGKLKKAKLFGDLKILDAPALVYLVAPLMSFHRDFEILAHTITPEIEIWRFDLNEDWRSGIKIARRTKVS